MINGHETTLTDGPLTPEPAPLEKAQQRLAKACMNCGMNPAAAGISGFLNSMLTVARLDALAEVVLEPPNESWTLKEAFEAATVRQMNAKAEQLETSTAQQRIQVAPADARIVRPS